MIIKGKKIELHPYDAALKPLLFKWHNNQDFDDLMSDEVGPKSILDIDAIYSKFLPPSGSWPYLTSTSDTAKRRSGEASARRLTGVRGMGTKG